MYRKLKIMATLFTFVVIGVSFVAPSAFANSVGQCGGEVSTGLQLYHNWQSEGVSSEAAQLVGKPAGFKEMDGSFKSFMKNRVGKFKLAATATIKDYGCSGGSIFGAGTRTIARDESVMAALPLQYSKGEARSTPHAGYKRIVASVHVVGKVECSNPFKEVVRVFIYVKVPKHHPRHHHKHHHKKCGCSKKPPPKESGVCNGNTVTNGTSCGGGICSPTTVVGGSGNTVTVNQPVECKPEEKSPPPPPTCEETGTCPPGIYTEIGCVGFEEVSGEAGFHVDCTVSTNTGKPISLEAHSNDSNSQVSGINCYSNSGLPTCPSSGGTFEFFVEGNNNSSSVKYSSVTAVASAGGVKSTPFISDPYKVDPSDGGF